MAIKDDISRYPYHFPYPVKSILYLAFEVTPCVRFEQMDKIMMQMGWLMQINRTIQDEINTFPDKHPYPVKCMLYILFKKAGSVSFEQMHKALKKMGWIPMTTHVRIGEGLTSIRLGWLEISTELIETELTYFHGTDILLENDTLLSNSFITKNFKDACKFGYRRAVMNKSPFVRIYKVMVVKSNVMPDKNRKRAYMVLKDCKAQLINEWETYNTPYKLKKFKLCRGKP